MKQLTKEELRLKCAEGMNLAPRRGIIGRRMGWWTKDKEPLPDYPADLQACADLRASLTTAETMRYGDALALEIDPTGSFTIGMMIAAIANASAEQHCYAYLAAKGLMNETGGAK